MDKTKIITKEQLINDFKNLGIISGDILNLKISLKSIGFVEGGADTVIDALLEVVGEEGTLVTDSFVEPFPLILKFKNKNNISTGTTLSYAGAITNAIMKKPNVFRASHPIQRFAAIGKYAKKLTQEFTIDSPPYDFLKKMAEMNAKNIRVGGLDKVVGVGTTHIAICAHKLKQKQLPKGIYYKDKDDKIKLFKIDWADGCPVGFNNLIQRFRNDGIILSEEKVGNSEAILTSMKDTLSFEMDLLSKEPGAFLCDDPTCHFCSFNWKASKRTFFSALFSAVKRKEIKKAIKLISVKLLGKSFPHSH